MTKKQRWEKLRDHILRIVESDQVSRPDTGIHRSLMNVDAVIASKMSVQVLELINAVYNVQPKHIECLASEGDKWYKIMNDNEDTPCKIIGGRVYRLRIDNMMDEKRRQNPVATMKEKMDTIDATDHSFSPEHYGTVIRDARFLIPGDRVRINKTKREDYVLHVSPDDPDKYSLAGSAWYMRRELTLLPRVNHQWEHFLTTAYVSEEEGSEGDEDEN